MVLQNHSITTSDLPAIRKKININEFGIKTVQASLSITEKLA
jgi:hypothetical protein